MERKEIKLLGGIGEKKSNGGTQYYEQDRIYSADHLATSVVTVHNPYYATRERESSMGELKIRKLTPGECAKLMGFEKKDQVAMQELNLNDSAQYHIFGDSIVVTCLIGLFGMLLPISEQELQQKIEDYVERLVTE